MSISACVVRMTGIALGWNVPTNALGSVGKKPKMSFVASPSLTFRTEVQLVQLPAKQASGRLSFRQTRLAAATHPEAPRSPKTT